MVQPGRSKTKRAAARRRPGVLAGLAVFLLICGAILLFGTPGSDRGGGPGREARERQLTPTLLELVEELQAAEAALAGANYGECQRRVRKVRSKLTLLLRQMHAGSTQEDNSEPQLTAHVAHKPSVRRPFGRDPGLAVQPWTHAQTQVQGGL